MDTVLKKILKKKKCDYCGDAPVNHFFSFFESILALTLNVSNNIFLKHVPKFLKDFAEDIPFYLFRIFHLFKLVRFSSDIEKSRTLRSKVIWLEAERRGIKMEQIILFGKPIDQYRAHLKIGNKMKDFYFDSIPLRPEFLEMSQNWDNKAVLKKEFSKLNIPVPVYFTLPFHIFLSSYLDWEKSEKILEKIFSRLP